jgi:hypothetical protein
MLIEISSRVNIMIVYKGIVLRQSSTSGRKLVRILGSIDKQQIRNRHHGQAILFVGRDNFLSLNCFSLTKRSTSLLKTFMG